MQYCLVGEGYIPFLVGVVLRLFDTLSAFFSARLLAVAENIDEIQRAVSREIINQQAERLLTEHGDAVLRMAYS